MTQRSAPLADQPGSRDALRILWPLLALVLLLETLYSSRWLQPKGPRQQAVSSPSAVPGLQKMLQQRAPRRSVPLKVWFAPYTTFPETGFVESTSRKGIYDTLLAFPAGGGLASNYGATKLSAADGAFAMVSVLGLGQELMLARSLGYDLFVVDRGALLKPDALTDLCRRTSGCSLSADGYVLFPLTAISESFPREISPLRRRFQLLPMESAGPSWRSLVFDPKTFSAPRISSSPGSPGSTVFSIEATRKGRLYIFRYPLNAYPEALRPWFRLANDDVVLTVPPATISAELCIGREYPACQVVRLSGERRSLAIGSLLLPGQLTRISLVNMILNRQRHSPRASIFRIEVRSPTAFAIP
ncbi:MAG: hypothetical protein ACKO8I_05600 [Cyanobacteriota bacterium]